MLKAEHITKSYGAGKNEYWSLKGVNIEVGAGEFLVIRGGEKSGKSTLLSIMGLFDKPTAGKYYFREQEVTTLPATELDLLRKRNIGYVFQNFNLIGALTVYENVELPLMYMGLEPKQRKLMVHEALESMGLLHRATKLPGILNPWQQKLIALARAIVGRPALVLVDEPVKGFNQKGREAVMKALSLINEAGTTVIVTTGAYDINRYAHRSLVLQEGHVIAEGMMPYTF